jgi:hypothetical protein
MFEIAWFWTKDPKGLERLNQADMLALGLHEPCPSKMRPDWCILEPSSLEDLRIVHEVFGFAADSPDIVRLLDLPIASVEWDGMHLVFLIYFVTDCPFQNTGGDNGPLTPWELLDVEHLMPPVPWI